MSTRFGGFFPSFFGVIDLFKTLKKEVKTSETSAIGEKKIKREKRFVDIFLDIIFSYFESGLARPIPLIIILVLEEKKINLAPE